MAGQQTYQLYATSIASAFIRKVVFFFFPWVIDFDNLVESLLTVNNLLVRSTTQGCIISFCSIQLELLWGSFPIMYSVGQTSRLTLQFFIIY